ncbi:MAG: hypothetical protein WAQ28_04000 [Bacteroidia bacterium]
MKKEGQMDFEKGIKEIQQICYLMLENVPQGMSNVSSILEILNAVNKLGTTFRAE